MSDYQHPKTRLVSVVSKVGIGSLARIFKLLPKKTGLLPKKYEFIQHAHRIG
jgi:hypothetical protein